MRLPKHVVRPVGCGLVNPVHPAPGALGASQASLSPQLAEASQPELPSAAPSRGGARSRARRVVGALLLVSLVGAAALPATEAAAADTVQTGVYQNSSSHVTLHGSWKTVKSSHELGGSYASLAKSGYAKLTFRGNGVAWIARKNGAGGLADVYVDGKKTKRVDLYAKQTKFRQTVYKVTGLKSATHTIKVVRTGKKSSASKGRNLMVDAFQVLDGAAPATPTGVRTTPIKTGAKVSWSAVSAADLTGYRLYRQAGSASAVRVATLGAKTTSFADVGLTAGTGYSYRVEAVDGSQNVSARSAAVTFTTARPSVAALVRAGCGGVTTTVGNRPQLLAALAAARPGSVIQLRPGTYPGKYHVKAAGTAGSPVAICGPRSAVIDGGDPAADGGIKVDFSAHVLISGISVTRSQKGISVLNSRSVVIRDTHVHHIGDEAIHLKNSTTDSTVSGNTIDHTGLSEPGYGEGVYVGTAKSNWCAYTGCQPDRSDRNTVTGNSISSTRAESVEVKEGTRDGYISGNTLDGSGTDAANRSVIKVKGNGWVVNANTARDTPEDAVIVMQVSGTDGGHDNIVYANTFTGRLPGFGVRLPDADLGNYVGCEQTVPSSARRLTQDSCQL